jgi:hypothetical protein
MAGLFSNPPHVSTTARVGPDRDALPRPFRNHAKYLALLLDEADHWCLVPGVDVMRVDRGLDQAPETLAADGPFTVQQDAHAF